ncbi:MAG: hypothetical protein AB7Q27_09250, partial [Acidimicrobiia bacterium]
MTRGSSDEAGGQPDLWSVLPAGLEVTTTDANPQWPEHTRFPLNLRGRTVRSVVWDDLAGSPNPLIVTG